MRELDRLLGALRARIEAFQHGDPSQVLDPEAIAEAAQLWEAAQSASLSDPQRISVIQTLAYFHWARYLLLPDGDDSADFGVANMLFGLLSTLDPKLVPDAVRRRRTDDNPARQGREAVAILKRVLTGDDAGELDHAIDLLRQAIANTPTDDPRRSGYVSNLAVALNTRFDRVGQLADIDEALQLLEETVKAIPAGSADSWQDLTNLGLAHRSRYERVGEISNLNEAVHFLREAAEATQPDHPGRAGLLQNLVISLLVRYDKLADVADVEEAIKAGEEAVAASPPDDADRRHRVFNLGNAFKARFDRTGQLADLDDAVRLLREAAEATPAEEPDRAEKLNNLIYVLSERFERMGAIDDLEEEIQSERMRLEVTAADDPERAERLSNLGGRLLSRFEKIGGPADLQDGIKVSSEALGIASAGHAPIAGFKYTVSRGLISRFEQHGDIADLEEAIRMLREAVESSPQDPQSPTYMSLLGLALRLRYARQPRQEDIDESVDYCRQAVNATTTGKPVVSALRLSHLGVALRARFEGTDQLDDLDEAVQAFQAAAEATPSSHVDWGGRQSNLGFALWVRFSRLGRMADLDEAVRVLRQAVNASAPYPIRQAAMLSNMAVALRIRFEQLGHLSDLHEAVGALRKAIKSTPATQSDLPGRLLNLSVALRVRFERIANLADINDAVQAARDSVTASPPGDPRRPGRLSNLAATLQVRFHRLGRPADIEEAVQFAREAVAAGPAEGEEGATRLSTLALALRNRFESARNTADLDEAIRVYRQALGTIEDNHPTKAILQTNFGGILRTRFEETRQLSDAASAIAAFQQASRAETATVLVRLRAATAWGQLAASLDVRSRSAVQGYKAAVDLLPVLAWRGVDRLSRERLIAEFPLLAGDAAACAIAARRPTLAVELLEQGRAVLWSQLLETRSDLADLKNSAHDELALRLEELRRLLDAGAVDTDVSTPAAVTESPASVTVNIDDRMRMAKEWDDLVNHVRTLPGFHSFLRRPNIQGLQNSASAGPVIIVNISRWSCDALVVAKSGVTVIPLRRITLQSVTEHTDSYLTALEEYEERIGTDIRMARAAITALEQALTETLGWLWDNIVEPVMQGLGYTATPALDDHWPRVWWCPTGPLTILPLHAAGKHDPQATANSSTVDRVISSYVPTLRTLVEARASSEAEYSPDEERLLLVALADAPGQTPLPQVIREREFLTELFQDRCTVLKGSTATRHSVRNALPLHAWAHLSCHGGQILDAPSQGGLLLHDGMLTVADIAESRNSRGQLMFLSACKTMTGGTANLDEIITLATAMQYTGWQQVIATTWSVWADTAADVTEQFYPPIFADNRLHATDAAKALHNALRRLRIQNPSRPSIWAPFVHVGI